MQQTYKNNIKITNKNIKIIINNNLYKLQYY